jgi:hypothetical protein
MEDAMTNRKGRSDEAEAKFIERGETIEKERMYVDDQRSDCAKTHRRLKGQKSDRTAK